MLRIDPDLLFREDPY